MLIRNGQLVGGHLHAYSEYRAVGWKHFMKLLLSIVVGKVVGARSVTAHLPLEFQHPDEFRNIMMANSLIRFGEYLKKLFNIKLYWENAPLLNFGTWDLKYENTDWENVPKNINLCLDTGHLMLGVKTKKEFLKTLDWVLKQYGEQLKHLHLHENDFKSDQHLSVPGKIIDKKLRDRLITSRSFIYEKGE